MKKWLCHLFFCWLCLSVSAQKLESNSAYLRYRGTFHLQPWVMPEEGLELVRNWFPKFYPDKKFFLVKYDSINHTLEVRRSFVLLLPNCQKEKEKGIVTYRLFFQGLKGEVRYSMYSFSHRQFRSDDEILQERIERQQATDQALAAYWSTVPALAGAAAAASSNNESKFVEGAVGAAALFGLIATVAVVASNAQENNYLKLGYLKADYTTENLGCGLRRRNDTLLKHLFSEVADEHKNLSQSLQQFIRAALPQFEPLEYRNASAKASFLLTKRDITAPSVFDGDTLKGRSVQLTDKPTILDSPALSVPFFEPSWSSEYFPVITPVQIKKHE